jgi:uncharacterized protein (DUF1778 family)
MQRKTRAKKQMPAATKIRRASQAASADTRKVSNWSFRVETSTQQLIDAAAEVEGSSRTDFVMRSARERAIEVLLNRRLFTLSSSEWTDVVRALDNPIPANAKLKALLAIETPW